MVNVPMTGSSMLLLKAQTQSQKVQLKNDFFSNKNNEKKTYVKLLAI